jgi:hypothetical protein
MRESRKMKIIRIKNTVSNSKNKNQGQNRQEYARKISEYTRPTGESLLSDVAPGS